MSTLTGSEESQAAPENIDIVKKPDRTGDQHLISLLQSWLARGVQEASGAASRAWAAPGSSPPSPTRL